MKSLAMILALAILAQGCAGIIEMRVPKQFKGSKLKEDPPISMVPCVEATCARQA